MNFAKVALDNKVTTLVLTVMTVLGGMMTYQSLGRLEDPEFTIKDALVITAYPGATALEVEEEVSDELERAVQMLSQLHELESKSERGLSTLTVTVQDRFDADSLPQVWDELRRKIGDAQGDLPPGAGPSLVVDDFGDVYGIFYAIYGEGYSYKELEDYADFLRTEILLVPDVAKVDFFGLQPEAVYVELDRDRMAQLGIQTSTIINELQQKNVIANAGRVEVGTDFLSIRPTGTTNSVEDFESILLSGAASESQIFLRDVAAVRRDYLEPPRELLRFDGVPAIGLGISTVADGNVVTMGELLKRRLDELESMRPIGMELETIAMQSDAVIEAIDSFIISLAQAVIIVVVVLLFFMGLRSGLLIGFILFLTICATFIMMGTQGITLERISLGALIIALGMLVDNAIVVVDGMLIKMQKGVERNRAAIEVVQQAAMPLLGATMVAILAFAAIGTSQDKTGEYTRSLFQVILYSLSLSWLTAVTVTPVLGVMFLKVKPPKAGEENKDPYGGAFYRGYKGFLRLAIRGKLITVLVIVGLFYASLTGFGYVENSFFPDSTRPQFMVDFWLPQGTHIDDTVRHAIEIDQYIRGLENVEHVASVIGGGATRFLLTYAPEKSNSGYVQFLVEVDDFTAIDRLIPEIQTALEHDYPHAIPNLFRFVNGPGEPGKIRARIMGPDRGELRRLAGEVEAIFRQDPQTIGVRIDWGAPTKIVRPVLAEEQANVTGITRPDVALTLLQGFEGAPVGVYREGDDLLSIILRAPDRQRLDVASMQNLQIWSPGAQKMIPLRQVVSGFETTFEDDIIFRQDRRRTITVYADPRSGNGSVLLARLQPQVIDQVELPPGYQIEWWGEIKDSTEAQTALAGSIPTFVVIMVLIVVALFNSVRQALVIWLTVPLALIGVTVGLLVTEQPFGFMALLGFLSLSGMLIKNAIVLIDEINAQSASGKDTFNAIVDSGAGRLRPVAMAAVTTILGMTPLFADAFFVAMAVTIAFGLGFATVLTMVVVPVLYAIFYRAKYVGPGGPDDTSGAVDRQAATIDMSVPEEPAPEPPATSLPDKQSDPGNTEG
jgi:multidrug efflux pump subunit AcrB